MPHDSCTFTTPCTLTTKDFTILEVMLDRSLDPADAMTALLRRKLDSAIVVFRDDVPPQVATLSSRVSFSVDGGEPDSRILSHDRMSSPVGLYLPITARRGLALLGLTEGQVVRITNHDGAQESIQLHQVLYQPEAARREKQAMARQAAPQLRRSTLRVITGALAQERAVCRVPAPLDDGDDPGPSAA